MLSTYRQYTQTPQSSARQPSHCLQRTLRRRRSFRTFPDLRGRLLLVALVDLRPTDVMTAGLLVPLPQSPRKLSSLGGSSSDVSVKIEKKLKFKKSKRSYKKLYSVLVDW